ncbi:MAG: hypothetical protein IPO09_18705 [Anaeromyxobacter sp.]|nr:hypothetical protein [Anaeromyxobacter sp.]
MTPQSTRGRLTSWVDLALPEFSGSVPVGEVRQATIRPRRAAEWLGDFEARLSMRSGFLPIYRMSDGEFVFVCGWRPYTADFLLRYPRMTMRSWAKALLKHNVDQFRSGTVGYGFENYTPEEWKVAREGYGRRVQQLSAEGILAVNYVSHLHFPRQYIRPMCDWMDANRIHLDEQNYFPFYFVYALLLGPGADRFYRGRRILVVTSDEDGTKAPGIERTLLALGAESMQFRKISRSKSMLDRVDLGGLRDVDLVLVGAGVGALNVLEQVRPLAATSIDVGYVLDCLWQPKRFVGQRAFTVPDQGSPLLRVTP